MVTTSFLVKDEEVRMTATAENGNEGEVEEVGCSTLWAIIAEWENTGLY